MTRNPNPGRQPLLWAALMFSAGVWVGAHAWRPAAWWIVAVLGFALATLWFLRRRSWVAKGLSLGTWFVLGAFLIQIRSAPGGDAGILAFADGREVTIEAHVAREGYARAAGPRSIRQPVDVETEAVEGLPIRAGVRLTIYEKIEDQGVPCEASTTSGDPTSAAKADPDKQFFAALKRCATQNPGTQNPSTQNPRVDLISQNAAGAIYGTRLRIRAKLHPPRNYRNPGAFDYEGYLRDHGIVVLGSARAQDVEQLPGLVGSRIERWRTRIHASIVRKIHELWPSQQASLIDAMALGEDAFLEGGTRTEFQRSGTYHVLVVSGMNLSILAFVIFSS